MCMTTMSTSSSKHPGAIVFLPGNSAVFYSVVASFVLTYMSLRRKKPHFPSSFSLYPYSFCMSKNSLQLNIRFQYSNLHSSVHIQDFHSTEPKISLLRGENTGLSIEKLGLKLLLWWYVLFKKDL